MEEPAVKKRKGGAPASGGKKLLPFKRPRPPPLTPQDSTYDPRPPQLVPASEVKTNFYSHQNTAIQSALGVTASAATMPGAAMSSFASGDTSALSSDGRSLDQFFAVEDHPHNKKGFRYVLCKANPQLSSVLYQTAEVEPRNARLSYEDKSPQAFLSKDCMTVTTFRGFRSARANVFMASGDWYFEVKVISSAINGCLSVTNSSPIEPSVTAGVENHSATITTGDSMETDEGPSISPSPAPNPARRLGHVRIGISRREASLEAPVGHDAYGYALRDVTGEKVHVSRPIQFLNEPFGIGDVIGFHVSLPERPDLFKDVYRDRIPIWYKGQHLFEILDYIPTKLMDNLMLPTAMYKKKLKDDEKKINIPTIPNSYIRIYKNGKDMGIPFSDLKDFLPPNSRFQPNFTARDDANDGSVGYYPTISVFQGGAATLNFGPQFWFPPETVRNGSVRPLCERYDEQIAEDIVFDLIDQVGYEEQDRLDDEAAERLRQEQEEERKLQLLRKEEELKRIQENLAIAGAAAEQAPIMMTMTTIPPQPTEVTVEAPSGVDAAPADETTKMSIAMLIDSQAEPQLNSQMESRADSQKMEIDDEPAN